MSTGTPTPFVQLNQWNPYDKVRMEDFNKDNAKLDTVLQGLASSGTGGGTGTPDSIVFTAEAVDENGVITLSGVLPDIFTVRFVAPKDYAAGDTIQIDGAEMTIQGSNLSSLESGVFKKGMLVSLEVDRVNGNAFYNVPSGSGGEGPGPGSGSYGILPRQTEIEVYPQVSGAELKLSNPGGEAFAGTQIVYKPGTEMPASLTDGTLLDAGTASDIEITGLISNDDYTVRSFAYNHQLEYQTDIVGAVQTFKVSESDAGKIWTLRESSTTNNLSSVIYGDGIYLATTSTQGSAEAILTSSDAIHWTNQNYSGAANAVAYGNGKYIAVFGPYMSISDDGEIWSFENVNGTASWVDIIFANGKFVSITNNSVMTSTDGVKWDYGKLELGKSWCSIAYGNSTFVAVGSSKTFDNVMTSKDGMNWTLRESATNNSWQGVTYGNGLFVAVANSGTGNRVMTSPDGINWTSRKSALDSNWKSITYGNGLFVATTFYGTHVMQSSNGIDWSVIECPGNGYNSITYGAGKFVAVGNSGFIMTSP